MIVLCVLLAGALYGRTGRAAFTVNQTPTSTTIDFNRDIRPILSDKCFVCHGPGVPNRQSTLRLDSAACVTADLGGGRRAVVAGQAEKSELIRRVTATDEALIMPPSDSGRTLRKREIELLKEWIKQGAEWQKH